jgi:hypothetical protein
MRIVIEIDVPEKYRAAVTEVETEGDEVGLRELADNLNSNYTVRVER